MNTYCSPSRRRSHWEPFQAAQCMILHLDTCRQIPLLMGSPYGKSAASSGQKCLCPPEAFSTTETSMSLKPALWIRLHFTEVFHLQPPKSKHRINNFSKWGTKTWVTTTYFSSLEPINDRGSLTCGPHTAHNITSQSLQAPYFFLHYYGVALWCRKSQPSLFSKARLALYWNNHRVIEWLGLKGSLKII